MGKWKIIQVYGGETRGKRPLGRSMRKWEDNVKMNLRKMGCGVWTGLNWLGIETGGGHL
jgi:hypothetical protein